MSKHNLQEVWTCTFSHNISKRWTKLQRKPKSKRGTEANILQPKSLSKKGVWISKFPIASGKRKSANYITVWPNFTSSISIAFILDNFGDELKYGTARDRTLTPYTKRKHFCKELPNNFLFSEFKCSMWPTRVTTAVIPSFHCLTNP